MSIWDATTAEARDNLLRVVDEQAQDLFAMAAAPGAWEAPTLSTQWQVRDVVGHLIDVTESYFVGFDAARAGASVADALGTKAMQDSLDAGARDLRSLDADTALSRLQADYAKMVEIVRQLSDEEWQSLIVSHKFMGPLPAFFYPVFQLMDYGVHSWDIRQGSGRAHCLNSDVADLLVPFMFVLWSATADIPAGVPPCEIGVRILSGHNAGSWKVTAGPDAISYAQGAIDGLPTVLEFDPGSFVLTAFGRSNAGTVRGDVTVADRYLNMFFRI
jgi:uncharacterized protein (TIGR03083 family)